LLTSAIETHTLPLKTGRTGTEAGETSAVEPALVDALHSLLTLCSWAGRADLWPPPLSAIEDLRSRLPRTLHLRVQVLGDPARLDAATLAEFDGAIRAAGRGDEDLVRSLTEQMMRWATPRRVGVVQMFARHARGLSALGQSAFEEAYQQLSASSSPGAFPVFTAYVWALT